MFCCEGIALEEVEQSFLLSFGVMEGAWIKPGSLSWHMGSTIVVFVGSGCFVMTFAVVGFSGKNFIMDAVVNHSMGRFEAIIMRVLHGGIDLLIIDRPNKIDSRRMGLHGKRGKEAIAD
jgi:hypothetical protein